MTTKLTMRQEQVLDMIISNPNHSFKEMAEELGLSSVSNIHQHISKLVEKGMVRKIAGRYRAIDPKEHIMSKILRLERNVELLASYLVLDLEE